MEMKNPVNLERKGERFALTIVERATKWMRVYPLISKSAQGVVDSVLRFLGPDVTP